MPKGKRNAARTPSSGSKSGGGPGKPNRRGGGAAGRGGPGAGRRHDAGGAAFGQAGRGRPSGSGRKGRGEEAARGGRAGHASAGRTGQRLGRSDRSAALPVFREPGRRVGEWYELKLPPAVAALPPDQALERLPLPPKLADRLLYEGGVARKGSQLRLKLFPMREPDFPDDLLDPFTVLYEDDFSLVVMKPAGVEVHPSVQGQRKTLVHAVAAYYRLTNQFCLVRQAHRLDKDTTGPVLFAKNDLAQHVFDKGMREKRIERVYLALAEGEVELDRGTIDMPIGQDRHHSTRRIVSPTGDPAVTHYQVVERFPGYTLLRLWLETGRTHQIRVHLSAIGHPIAGDGMYGGKRRLISRQALHGEKLVWFHPWTGERMSVRAPLPDDFKRALDRLRHDPAFGEEAAGAGSHGDEAGDD